MSSTPVHRVLACAVLLAVHAAAPPPARAQWVRSEPADLRIATAAVGYGSARITDIGIVPDRIMAGLNMRADLHVLSLLLRNLPIRTYDAAFIDYTYGRMTSDPLLFLTEEEDRSNVVFGAGYQFLAGLDLGGLAVLGGPGWQQFTHDIGGSSMNGSATSAMARLEVGRRRHLVATGWLGMSGDKTAGARVDVPFFRRLNLTAMYWQSDGAAEVWTSQPGVMTPASARMLMVGVRSAEMR